MSAVVQPPPSLVPVAISRSSSSPQRKPTTATTARNKPRRSPGTGIPPSPQPRTPRFRRVNNNNSSGNVPSAEATSTASATGAPTVTTVVGTTTGTVNPAVRPRKLWVRKRAPKPPPPPSSENAGSSTGTKPTGAPVQQGPAEALPATPEVQEPQLVSATRVVQDSKQPPQTGEAKAAKSKPNGASQEKKRENKEKHFNLVLSAANATIAALAKYDLPCAVFGSLACKLYGSARYPKDVDLLVLQPPSSDPSIPTTTRTAEQIKSLILDANPRHFYLKFPRDPEATYRILHYREEYLGAECKVDILLPGTMNLPYIPPPPSSSPPEPSAGGSSLSEKDIPVPVPALIPAVAPSTTLAADLPSPNPRNHVNTISGIPLVPFSLLLLHKLQGWDDHRTAPETFKQRKQVQDAADIRRLLAMEEQMNELRRTRPWSDPDLFTEEFQRLTRSRVTEFCKTFPTSVTPWQLLGFETPQDTTEGEKEA